MIGRWFVRRWLRRNRDALVDVIWRDVKTTGYGPKDRAGYVLDRLKDAAR